MTERRSNGRPEEQPEPSGESAEPSVVAESAVPGSAVAESAAAASPASEAQPVPRGPFTLEHRPVPALYLVAWLLSLGGIAFVFVGLLAAARTWTPALVLGGLLSLGLGLTAAAGYQLVARRSRPAGKYRGPSPLLLFGIVLAFAQVIFGPLVLLGLAYETTTGVFVGALAISGGYIGTVTLLVVRSGALSWRDMRFPDRSALRVPDLARAVALGVATMPAAILLSGLVGGIIAAQLGVELQSPIPQPRNSADLVAFVLTAVVVAPLGEELFFRGYALTAWQLDLGPGPALVRSSIFFAAAHLLNLTATTAGEGLALAFVTFVIYLPLGFLLGWLFQRRGIVASIAGHAAANGTVVVLSLLYGSAAGP